MERITLRRASINDIDDIYKLIRKDDYSLNKLKLKYGTSNISYLIDNAVVSIVGIDNKTNQIIGFISVSLSPYKDYIKNKDWTVELYKHFEIKNCIPYNTMFLSCCVYDQNYSTDFLFYSLKQIYLFLPNLKYIGYLVPETHEIDKNLCSPVPPKSYNGCHLNKNNSSDESSHTNINTTTTTTTLKQRFFFNKCKGIRQKDDIHYSNSLWMCFRVDLVYILKIRKARVEDCDDLIPMFKQKNLMDDPDNIYYFSELLENNDENMNTIVGVVNDKIVGFMSMRSNIEYSSLFENFDLDMYETLFNDMYEVEIDEEILKNISLHDINNHLKKESQTTENKEKDKKDTTDSINSLTTSTNDNTNNNSDNNNDTTNQSVESIHDKSNSKVNIKEESNEVDTPSNNPVDELVEKQDEIKVEEEKKTEEDFPNDCTESIESTIDLKKMAYLSNAICINLFYIDECYSFYSNEFLKAAFNLYPDKEYCLISVSTKELYIPLFNNMSAVDYRENVNIRHSLYICHRESTLNIIQVRRGEEKDLKEIDKLICDMPEYNKLAHQLKMSILSMSNDTEINYKTVFYVAECLGMIVGFAILNRHSDPNALIEQFNIEKYCSKANHHFSKKDEFILSYIIMNPLYENKARYFLEEIMRLSDIECLIHTFNESFDFSTHKIITKEFVPIKRRKQIQYVDNKRDINTVANHLNYNISLITTNLLYEPKFTINTRIIVVGASDTGISFLETLIYKSHYLFNNLVLVSSKDTYKSKECPYAVDKMNYSVHDLKKMNIENYVQFINSTVNAINREDKTITLDNDEVIEYDYLIITTGLQFHPETLNKEFKELNGIFSGSEIESCIEFIDNISKSTDKNYVVYGNDIQAFPILKALINKVPAYQIHFVVPNFDKGIHHWFDNRSLEKRVLAYIKNLGVDVLLNYQLTSFEHYEKKLIDITLKSTINESFDSTTIFKIDGFFYVDKKTSDNHIFNAINDAYLVFDENLIIGSHFQTCDDYIFSAGPLTKYNYKYETLWNHSYYNSKEIGKKLALTLLPIFEGDEQAMKDIKREDEPLISFNDLVATRCLLPGDMMFFHFDRPYLYNQTKSFREKDKNYGRNLFIGNNKETTKPIEFFHIHMDTLGFIQSVTYVGKEDLFSENLLSLYGMHEKYLNRLVSRFDEGIIPDFKTFFNEPWAQPLFHDRFRAYMKRLRDDLMNPTTSSVPLLPLATSSSSNNNDNISSDEGEKPMEMTEILDKLYEYVVKKEIVPESERIKLYDSFDKSSDRKKIDNTVYRFLVESGFYNFP
ncbi:hypothetical protein U3516DRAFT_629731 [Neocallimastix sp. 'constans']|jgi:thioredoxin reductase